MFDPVTFTTTNTKTITTTTAMETKASVEEENRPRWWRRDLHVLARGAALGAVRRRWSTLGAAAGGSTFGRGRRRAPFGLCLSRRSLGRGRLARLRTGALARSVAWLHLAHVWGSPCLVPITGQWCTTARRKWARRMCTGVLALVVLSRSPVGHDRQRPGDGRPPGTSGRGGSTSTSGTPRPRNRRFRRDRRHSRASSVALVGQRPFFGSREPNTYVTCTTAVSSQMGQSSGELHTDVAGRPEKLGVGVTHVEARQASLAELAHHGIAGEAVLHSTTGSGDRESSQGRRPEAHRHKGTVGATRTTRESRCGLVRCSRPSRRTRATAPGAGPMETAPDRWASGSGRRSRDRELLGTTQPRPQAMTSVVTMSMTCHCHDLKRCRCIDTIHLT